MLQNYCGIEKNDSSGIILINDNKLKNTSLAFGKLLERHGVFVSGTLIIPLGRQATFTLIEVSLESYHSRCHVQGGSNKNEKNYIIYFRRNVAIFLSIAMTEGPNNDTNYWVDSGWKLRKTKRSSKKSNTCSIQTVDESSSLPLLTFR